MFRRVRVPALLLIAWFVVACGAKTQTVTLVNRTPRKIVEVYAYPIGSGNQGASRGTIEANGTLVLQLPVGHLEVRAVSERVKIDDRTNETREASTALQLKKSPVELVFHDSNQPAPADKPGTILVTFRIDESKSTGSDGSSNGSSDGSSNGSSDGSSGGDGAAPVAPEPAP